METLGVSLKFTEFWVMFMLTLCLKTAASKRIAQDSSNAQPSTFETWKIGSVEIFQPEIHI